MAHGGERGVWWWREVCASFIYENYEDLNGSFNSEPRARHN